MDYSLESLVVAFMTPPIDSKLHALATPLELPLPAEVLGLQYKPELHYSILCPLMLGLPVVHPCRQPPVPTHSQEIELWEKVGG